MLALPKAEVESHRAQGARRSGRFNFHLASGSPTHQTKPTVKRRERRAPAVGLRWRVLLTSVFRVNRHRNLAAMLLSMVAGSAALLSADPCVPIPTFADGQKPSREIFVATTGNNGTGDGSRTNPFQTLGRAAQGLQPGDAIRLLPGAYVGGTSLRDVAGSSNAPIWLGGVPGLARPVLSGGSTAIHFSRVRYLIVENMEVAGATGNGLNCDDGGEYANAAVTHHVLFRNLSIHDIGKGGNNDGLKLSGLNDFFVIDCEFARLSAGGSGIDHVGCHRGLIARSTFTDAGSNSIQCKGGSEDIEIRSNRFINGGGRAINIGGSTGFTFFRPPLSTNAPNVEAKNIRVTANLFRGGDAPVAFVGCVDSLFANNTIIEPRRWIVRILQETVSRGEFTFRPCANNRFMNNLVAFDRSHLGVPVNLGSNTDPGSFEFANNLWFAADQPGQSRPALPSAEAGGVYGLDPLFRDAAASDFSVPSNSPATGKGRPLPNVRADLRENCYAELPAIGAFEANPTASVLSPK
jgi:hypothetical protein